MSVTDQQVRLLKMLYEKSGDIQQASAKAGMCRQTGSKYIGNGEFPSNLKLDRHWVTRENPFTGNWSQVEEILEGAPEVEAKELFDWLCQIHPDSYQEGQLRTFQRHVSRWRTLHGPDKEVFFPQIHYPGIRMSTDCTSLKSLGITISGNDFQHLLCHCVLTYSNWEWATICFSESFLALRQGIQAALFQLGRTPREHWTDHSSAATHEPPASDVDQKRKFNGRYQSLMDHFGITPRTIQVNSPNENGDVESLNGALKNRIRQHLLLRGSCDFESIAAYEKFIQMIMMKANHLRREKLNEELKIMPLIRVGRIPEYDPVEVRVTSNSTVAILRNIYSVPSRLIGKKVKARCYEDRVEIFYQGFHQLTAARLVGRNSHNINYRHVINSLIRKPGAFSNYRYRSSMFPTLNFRRAYDQLLKTCLDRTATIEYLRILKHSADTMEVDVDAALSLLMEENITPRWEKVLELIPSHRFSIPAIALGPVDLSQYDSLLGKACA